MATTPLTSLPRTESSTSAPPRRRSKRQCEFLTRVLMVAVESGISQWGTCRTYRWWLNDDAASDESVDHLPCRPNAYATIQLTALAGGLGEGVAGPTIHPGPGTYLVGLDEIEVGIEALVELSGELEGVNLDTRLAVLRAWFAVDAAQITPPLADVIVQAGLFGTLVFAPTA